MANENPETENNAADLIIFNDTEALIKNQVSLMADLKPIEKPEYAVVVQGYLKHAVQTEKLVEDQRTRLVKPLNDRVKLINAHAKNLITPLSVQTIRSKKLLLDWANLQERNRLAAEAEKKAAEEKVQQIDQTLSDNSDLLSDGQKVDLAKEKLSNEQASQQVFVPEKVSGVTKRWTFEVTDLAQVPREYLVIDSAAVRKKIAGGAREIAGIRIYQEESISVRS